MKIINIILTTLILSLSSCVKMESILSKQKIWIGKWDSPTQYIEIGENGYGEWSTSQRKEEGAGWINDYYLVGKVEISETEIIFKEQRIVSITGIPVPAGARKKRLRIDEEPYQEINSNNEPVIRAKIDGRIFTKNLN